MSTPLSALSNILSSGIATIESTYAKHGATFPSMDELFQPAPFEEDEALCQTIDHVIAAASPTHRTREGRPPALQLRLPVSVTDCLRR
jgi:hypothetical protein